MHHRSPSSFPRKIGRLKEVPHARNGHESQGGDSDPPRDPLESKDDVRPEQETRVKDEEPPGARKETPEFLGACRPLIHEEDVEPRTGVGKVRLRPGTDMSQDGQERGKQPPQRFADVPLPERRSFRYGRHGPAPFPQAPMNSIEGERIINLPAAAHDKSPETALALGPIPIIMVTGLANHRRMPEGDSARRFGHSDFGFWV